MKKKDDISPVQFLLVLLGVIAWIVAGWFASLDAMKSIENRAGVAMASNNLAAAGVLGFSVAGGLCFLGCGLGGMRGKESDPPPSPPKA